MSGRPWFPFYVGDYLSDTGNLCTTEHGAYLLLILHYWQHSGLPSDEEELAAICRLTMPEWEKARRRLSKLFQDGWRHKRIDLELSRAAEKYEKRAAAGKRGGIAKAKAKQTASNATGNAVANGYQPQPHVLDSSYTLVESPRARVFQKLGRPDGFYEEGEFNNLTLTFPGVDLENRLETYWPWGQRQEFKPHEIKAAFFSTLTKEAGSTKALAESKAEATASPQLVAALRKNGWSRAAAR